MSSMHRELVGGGVPSVVVVDPRFDAYKPLAASARLGKITLHFRAGGAEALKLAKRLRVNAWLIAPELDDMTGHDLLRLLQEQCAAAGRQGDAKMALVEATAPGGRQWSLAADEARSAGADVVLSQPITLGDLELLLGLPSKERARLVAAAGRGSAYVTLPVGVGAAVIAIAMLMLG